MKLNRIAFSAVTAGALVLGPSAAAYAAGEDVDGYRAPGFTFTVSITSPTTGETTTIVIQGTPGQHITLTITSANGDTTTITLAGTKSLTKTADAAGKASFDVAFGTPGSYTLVATDADTGAVLATQVVAVPGAGGGGEGPLASTGSNEVPIALGGAALVLVGAGGVVLARRRRAQRDY